MEGALLMGVEWTEFKAMVDSKSLRIQEKSKTNSYVLLAFDDAFKVQCVIHKTDPANSEQEDYEENYQANVNLPISSPRDSDNSNILRTKTTKTGWHYEPRSLDFVTAKYASLYNRKDDGHTINGGTDYGDASLKFYDNSGGELTYQQSGYEAETEEEFQVRLTSNCVKSVMDWQPTYDMDMIGAIIMLRNAPTEDAYMWAIVAPDIPENLGGSIPHVAGGWNLSFFNSRDKIIIDGRGSKTMAYDPVYNSNKFRAIIKHKAGTQIGMQVIYEIFKA